MSDAQLETLASRAGLAVDWIDANGRPQKVAPSVLRNVLTGLGHPAGSAQEIDASLQELQQVQETRHLPPLLTADFGAASIWRIISSPKRPAKSTSKMARDSI
jgi:4-alpha-glucanotransferase